MQFQSILKKTHQMLFCQMHHRVTTINSIPPPPPKPSLQLVLFLQNLIIPNLPIMHPKKPNHTPHHPKQQTKTNHIPRNKPSYSIAYQSHNHTSYKRFLVGFKSQEPSAYWD